jgi:hypothetical protein
VNEAGRSLPRWAPLLLVLAAVSCVAAWTIRGIAADPGLAFLLARDGAQWLRAPDKTVLKAPLRAPVHATFRHEFRLEAPLEESVLFVTAFRSASVYLDGTPLLQEPRSLERWKAERRVRVPGPIAAGTHTLLIACQNDRGPPLARLRWPDANLRSGPDWLALLPSGDTAAVQPVEAIEAPALARRFPTVREAFLELLPWILSACVLGGAISWALEARPIARAGWVLDPARLRWGLLLALFLVGLNNLWNLELGVGRDYPDHVEYLKYVAEHRRLPEIAQASQNFQAPLFYLLAAALYQLLGALGLEDPTALRVLRVISLLSAVATLEVCYRLLRRVFPFAPAVQRVGLLMAASMPLLWFESPTVGNEPLAALLGAATALAALDLFQSRGRERSVRRFAAVGALWGLAALAKVSALVLAAPLALGFAWWAWSARMPLRDTLLRALAVCGSFLAICGWFFVGNQLRYGKAVIGGWDPQVGFEWWQFPGYRTIEQYTSFGEALHRPVFCLVQGLWDGLYAGLWFDLLLGGVPNRLHAPTWNYDFAIAALAWALLPTLALVAGAVRALGMAGAASQAGARPAFAAVFSFFVAGAYLASIVLHSLLVPYYSAMKTTYALAAVPSILVLITLGAAPLLRSRWGRAAVHGWLAAWILLVGVAYWAQPPARVPTAHATPAARLSPWS